MKYKFPLLSIILIMNSCNPFELPEQANQTPTNNITNMTQLVVPSNFTYQTVAKTTIKVTATDNKGVVMTKIPFKLYARIKDSQTPVLLMSAFTNAQGIFETKVNLPSTTEEILAETPYLGLPTWTSVAAKSSTIEVKIGETNKVNGFVGRGTSNDVSALFSGTFSNPNDIPRTGIDKPETFNMSYMGTYNTQGVPNYLMAQGDNVNQDILSMINVTLPEGSPVPTYNPQYISNNARTTIKVNEQADVYVTFVHEGAGYQNAVGYFSYPTNSPPQSANDIADHKVVFPNCSFVNSGGGLSTGNKVYLGRFQGGTTIEWFLIPNGWNGSSRTVSNFGLPVHYSKKEFNTFTTTQYRPHVVLLNDPNRELVLIGFEDLNRPSGDNDFNDAIFYVTTNPYRALDTIGMIRTQNYGSDYDNDGVPNINDECPTDATCASKVYTPSSSQYGTLAFEDLWPRRGDYDFNDLVVDYRFETILNGAGKATKMNLYLKLRAIGASFRNGFGIELPIVPNKIASVVGNKIKDKYITLSANGTEAGQSKATIIAFDNAYTLMAAPDGGFVNTEMDKTKITPYEFTTTITFSEPIFLSELGSAPFNPFMIVNKERGKEIHLAGGTPTSLASTAFFGTYDDDTHGSKYYLSKTNLPWALHFPLSFDYPIEKKAIFEAHTKFPNWVQSGGTNFADWYQSKTGYRLLGNIYNK